MLRVTDIVLISLSLLVLSEIQGFAAFKIKNENLKDIQVPEDGGFVDHPCQRECIEGESMECQYQLVVHNQQAMGPECQHCHDDESACADEECIYADGVSNPIMTINNQWPAPPIVVCENDLIVADVINHLDEATTMHWHGMHMAGAKDMDGAPLVTQNPIEPDDWYRYEFPADRCGTIWYHSHMGWQRALGVAAPFVIRQPKSVDPYGDLYDYDLREHILLLTDTLYDLEDRLPNNILVNGKGRNHLNKWADNDPRNRYERLTVSQGKRYRLRAISNGVTNCPIKVSVENHKILAITTDGNPMEPMIADSFYLTSAERLDFILEANQPAGKYWIKFEGNFDCLPRNLYQGAILQYEESLTDDNNMPDTNIRSQHRSAPQSFSRQLNILSEFSTPGRGKSTQIGDVTTLRLRSSKPLTWPADTEFTTYYTNFGLMRENDHIYMQVDGITFVEPQESLLQADGDALQREAICDPSTFSREGVDCTATHCECTNIRRMQAHTPTEIVIVNLMNSTHPFHLHGYTFRVVGQQPWGNVDELRQIEVLDSRGLLQRLPNNYPAIEKDTVQVPPLGYVIIRFISDNPGYWLYHCHIERHALLGMAGVLHVYEDE